VSSAGAAPALPHPRAGLGVALVLLTTVCFATLDSLTRLLGATLPVLLILTARYVFQAVVMGVWLSASRVHRLRPAHPRFQLLRGSLLLATSALSFYGVQYMPVPEFTAINLLTPVLVTLLAAWLLKEAVSPLRWALVLGAFVGALIVIRPGSGLFGWAVWFPLGCACTYASFQVLTSRLAALESPYTTHFWTGAVGTAIMLPVLALSPVDVLGTLAAATLSSLLLMAAVGACGTAGHLLLILALGMAPASRLMPFTYVQIAFAALLGWLLFRQLPDFWGWVGMGVISACGAASAWLNLRSVAAARRRADAAVAADTIAD
jgi:drug/metabolite transporter (DMT)-like permease